MKMKLIFFILSVFVLTSISACQQKVVDEWVKMNPDQKVDILFYFKKDTKNDDVNYFLNNVIGTPREDGRGYSSMEGSQAMFLVRTQDFEGYAIKLFESAKPEERENILKAINSSPLIYKVFENVVPNELVLDPVKAQQEKEQLEKVKRDNRPTKTILVTNSNQND
jgi:hypothetical protein